MCFWYWFFSIDEVIFFHNYSVDCFHQCLNGELSTLNELFDWKNINFLHCLRILKVRMFRNKLLISMPGLMQTHISPQVQDWLLPWPSLWNFFNLWWDFSLKNGSFWSVVQNYVSWNIPFSKLTGFFLSSTSQWAIFEFVEIFCFWKLLILLFALRLCFFEDGTELLSLDIYFDIQTDSSHNQSFCSKFSIRWLLVLVDYWAWKYLIFSLNRNPGTPRFSKVLSRLINLNNQTHTSP